MPKRTVKFLLVDDLDANLLALEGLLVREGLELLRANSGPEALELLLVHDIALALIDVQMPGMSGFELAELMRSTERTRTVPIIFLTAGAVDQQRRIRGYETGAVDFLLKPIDSANLINKANIFFELARQRRELEDREELLRDANDRLAETNGELAFADRRKDEFLAMLAHELRNPLAPILTGIEIMVSSPGNAAVVGDLAEMMRRQMSQMVHLIDDLLDISRINTGKISLKKKRISLIPALNEAIESSRPIIDRMRHQFTFETTEEDLVMEGDTHRLSQIVSNLLSNAAKYTPPQGMIDMKLMRRGDNAIIVVRDNGEGIESAAHERIFGLFQQVNPNRRDGLGIGLTLVRNLVELHNGSISVASDGHGKGSEFTVILPIQVDEVSQPVPEQSAVLTAPTTKRIMVVDDSETTVEVLSLFMQMAGMETAVAYDGEEAVQVASVFKPDMIFMDLGMPKMDGFEAARCLRENHPKALLVALSGWGRDEDRVRSKQAGFDGHAVKPVAPEDLRRFLAMLK